MRKTRQLALLELTVVGAYVCTWLPLALSAQSYPAKPIRMVLGYTPGGTVDLVARLVAQRLSDIVGEAVIVENQAGASGSIANQRVAKSPADGYTLLVVPYSITNLPSTNPNLPYDLTRDFTPISLIALGTSVLVVHPSVPAKNVRELIALARSGAGKLNFATDGIGSSAYVAGKLFNFMAGIEIVDVPYKGASEAAIAIAGGQVELGYPGLGGALPLIKSGKLRPLAVTSGKRSFLLSAVPTINESGLPGYDRPSWYGVLAPGGMNASLSERINKMVAAAVNTPEVRDTLNRQALDPQTSTMERLAEIIRNEIAQNAELLKKLTLKK